MSQSTTRKITEALRSREGSGPETRSTDRMVISRDDLEAAVAEGVAEGLEEHRRRVQEERESRSRRSDSSSPVVKLLGSVILLAAVAYMRRKLTSGSGSQSGGEPRHRSSSK